MKFLIYCYHQDIKFIDNYIMIITNKSTNNKNQYIFIIGRGRKTQYGHVNFPINPKFEKSNCIFIDYDQTVNADIEQRFEDVDYHQFGICKGQINENAIIKFYFDWSSFYCTIQNIKCVAEKIGRTCQFFVPLSITENSFSSETENSFFSNVVKTLTCDFLTFAIVEGSYPLFDWTNDIPNMLSKTFNSNKYIKIYSFEE